MALLLPRHHLRLWKRSTPRPLQATDGLAPSGRLLQVAFVCTGNRARSPLAEALFRRWAEGLPVRVTSFGTMDVGGVPPLEGAREAAEALGLDISAHRARRLEPGGLRDYDLVIGFEQHHVTAAVDVGGAARGSVFMLLELPDLYEGEPPEGPEPPVDRALAVIAGLARRRAAALPAPVSAVADPFGGPPQAFAEAARVIELISGSLVARLFRSEPRVVSQRLSS